MPKQFLFLDSTQIIVSHRLCPGKPRDMGHKDGYYEGEVPINPSADWTKLLKHSHGIGGGEGPPGGPICPYGFFRIDLGPLDWSSSPYQFESVMVRSFLVMVEFLCMVYLLP